MTLHGLCVEITSFEVGLFILIAQSGASQALYVLDQVNIIYKGKNFKKWKTTKIVFLQ